jgi:hypothetical protein
MLRCEDCKLRRAERVGRLFKRTVHRCGIHERFVGLDDRCSATIRELIDCSNDLIREVDARGDELAAKHGMTWAELASGKMPGDAQ